MSTEFSIIWLQIVLIQTSVRSLVCTNMGKKPSNISKDILLFELNGFKGGGSTIWEEWYL